MLLVTYSEVVLWYSVKNRDCNPVLLKTQPGGHLPCSKRSICLVSTSFGSTSVQLDLLIDLGSRSLWAVTSAWTCCCAAYWDTGCDIPEYLSAQIYQEDELMGGGSYNCNVLTLKIWSCLLLVHPVQQCLLCSQENSLTSPGSLMGVAEIEPVAW